MAASFIQDLMQRKIEVELREPSMHLPIPGLGILGIILPHPFFWAQLAVVVGIQSVLNGLAGLFLYYFVVPHRGSIQSYVLGYSLLPILVSCPPQIMRNLGPHNLAMVVGQTASVSVVFFRCLMAIHDTLPPYAESDLQNFVLFFVSPVQFEFDKKAGQVIRSTSDSFRRTLWITIQGTLELTLLLNFVRLNDYEIVARNHVETFLDLFHWRHLLNNYVMAYLVGVCLSCGSMLVGTSIEFLSGMKVIKLCDNALTKSQSPSEFWGRRWNALVHIVLKGGVYLPLRKNGIPTSIASFVTFAASGLFHEYILGALALAVSMREDLPGFTPFYGSHLIFFAWNGFVLIGEGLLYKHSFIQSAKQTLPKPLITAMVIMVVLPIAHWFTDEYQQIGFFDDYAVGFPKMTWSPSRWERQ